MCDQILFSDMTRKIRIAKGRSHVYKCFHPCRADTNVTVSSIILTPRSLHVCYKHTLDKFLSPPPPPPPLKWTPAPPVGSNDPLALFNYLALYFQGEGWKSCVVDHAGGQVREEKDNKMADSCLKESDSMRHIIYSVAQFIPYWLCRITFSTHNALCLDHKFFFYF